MSAPNGKGGIYLNLTRDCDLRLKITRKVLNLARNFLCASPLEFVEASIVGRIQFQSDNRIEIQIESFRHSSSTYNHAMPTLPEEISIPLFLLRDTVSSVLSTETFCSKIRGIWIKSMRSSSPLRLADYFFIWATAGFDGTPPPSNSASRELAWFNVSAIVPGLPIFLRKIKNYPFDSDYFRYCVQNDTGLDKFRHLSHVNASGHNSDFRFGFFLMDNAGCLVPYLDGDPILESSVLAGVWCTGVDEVASFSTWLALFRYAFHECSTDKYRRSFCTSPILALHNRVSNKVSFYSIHAASKSMRPGSTRTTLLFPPMQSGYTYADRLSFHLFTGHGCLRAFTGPAKTASDLFALRLDLQHDNTGPADVIAKSLIVKMNLGKLETAVGVLGTELQCRHLVPKPSVVKPVQSGLIKQQHPSKPVQSVRTTPLSHRLSENCVSKRSVKFTLPETPPTVKCEVPDVSLLVEECVRTHSPFASTDALPRNPLSKSTLSSNRHNVVSATPSFQKPWPSPLATNFSTPVYPNCSHTYDPNRYFQKSLCQPTRCTTPMLAIPVTQQLRTMASEVNYHSNLVQPDPVDIHGDELARLERIIEKLLITRKEPIETNCVGTNTSFENSENSNRNVYSHASVAVNTSQQWPTLASIGLLCTTNRTQADASSAFECTTTTNISGALEVTEENEAFSAPPITVPTAFIAPYLLPSETATVNDFKTSQKEFKTTPFLNSPDSAMLVDSSLRTPTSRHGELEAIPSTQKGPGVEEDLTYSKLLLDLQEALGARHSNLFKDHDLDETGYPIEARLRSALRKSQSVPGLASSVQHLYAAPVSHENVAEAKNEFQQKDVLNSANLGCPLDSGSSAPLLPKCSSNGSRDGATGDGASRHAKDLPKHAFRSACSTDESAILSALVKKYLSPSLVERLTNSPSRSSEIRELSCDDHANAFECDRSMTTCYYLQGQNLVECENNSNPVKIFHNSSCSQKDFPNSTDLSLISLDPDWPLVQTTDLSEVEVGFKTSLQLKESECFSQQVVCELDELTRQSNPVPLSVRALASSTDSSRRYPLPVECDSNLDKSCSHILDLEHLRRLPKLL